MNIQKRMDHGNKNTGVWNFRRMATAAAALMLAAGVFSFPVRAFVTSVVKERMESVPVEEMKGLNDMVQSQHDVQADSFSREYSDSEKERKTELRQAYENGTFPEKVIVQVDNAKAAPEGTLCYVRDTGTFHLPAAEMTDEELLEIIDFQHKMSYAVSQESSAQDVRAAEQAKAAQLEKIVQDAGGISREEAVEIAKKQLKTDVGGRADGLELMTDSSGSGASLAAASDYSGAAFEKESKADVVYDVSFGNPDLHSSYGYIIDAVDGSILYTYKSN
ncbi:MAG: hypothetical protein NC416_14235 [Eubacterium sp.]|nr:hypothetical protein [Eubacterium sp.]